MNIRIIVSLVFMVIGTSNLAALSEHEVLFIKAADAYKQHNFKEAQELYAKIPDKTSGVYYNLGNCAFKQQLYGYALLCWRRAERDWGIFNRSELRHNIEIVRTINEVKDAKKPEQNPLQKLGQKLVSCKDALASFVRSVPLGQVQLLFLIAWILFFALLRFVALKKYAWLFVLVNIVIVSSVTMLTAKYVFLSRDYAVVVSKQTPLLTGPGETYQVLKNLSEVQEVVIQKESGDYYKIKVAGVVGWVQKKNIEKI